VKTNEKRTKNERLGERLGEAFGAEKLIEKQKNGFMTTSANGF
jgi:hypothetical protein